ncbi:MAG: phenylalanine--tRNA ligase subunit alpha [Methanomicrobiales archaeon]|nr:phenylalanine--tRNA ligase subunit alpha [Methanomicrobiales archaeon]
MDLTQNEKRLLATLAPLGEAGTDELATAIKSESGAVLQYAHLLQDKGLVRIVTETIRNARLTDEGVLYAREGLPERQLYAHCTTPVLVADLNRHPLAKIGIGWMKRKGWVTIRDGVVTRTGVASPGPDEIALLSPDPAGEGIDALLKRSLVIIYEVVTHRIAITATGEELFRQGLDMGAEVGTLTHEMILSGAWRTAKLRRYSIGTLPKRVFPGKLHPYQRLIEEMRQILLEMGFEEIQGDLVQSAFWNFDALFQPQDHPAREMQDTFYLNEHSSLPEGYERVRAMHEHGGETSSTGWGGSWSPDKARECVLRTHTTCLSIQHLAAHPNPPVKAFCISRVYRREAIDPTHLPEFEQLEGIVMDEGVHFGNLLGYLREFYGRMGFSGVRFRPGYFPYTEPSVEPEVYVEGLGWIEMGGAGIFREEVTAPWGIRHPVLAWGLGVSRIGMLRLGLRDLRHLYRSDLALLRDTPSHHPGRPAPGGGV